MNFPVIDPVIQIITTQGEALLPLYPRICSSLSPKSLGAAHCPRVWGSQVVMCREAALNPPTCLLAAEVLKTATLFLDDHGEDCWKKEFYRVLCG